MEIINKCISENKIDNAIHECEKLNFNNLGNLLKQIFDKTDKTDKTDKIKIQLLCNWCTTEELTNTWNKMSKGMFTWNNIVLVKENPDYYVAINSTNFPIDKKRTIVFRMEPHMDKKSGWGEWSNPKSEEFLKVFRHETDYNNNEWHLSKNYNWLMSENIIKKQEYNNVLSTVLSSKYSDPGHIKRIDFVKFAEKKIPIHVYGDNKWNYEDYRGSLPYHCKDDAILPYKYCFNVENHFIKNYYTEKLIDCILGESLCFYSGCYNISEFLDPRAYVYLELSNFEHDLEIVKRAINEDWHTKRLPFIREAKKKILNKLQFFPRLENFFKKLNK